MRAALSLARAACAASAATAAAAARERLARPLSQNSKTATRVVLALCAATAVVLALCVGLSFPESLARVPGAASAASASAASAAAAKNASARAVADMEAERAALGPGARVLVDPGTLRAARACGDKAVAALADELERAAAAGRGWPLAVARAQMRAALDAASAASVLREAAEAERQDREERRAFEARFAEAEEAEAEAALQQSKTDRRSGKAQRRRRATPAPESTLTTRRGAPLPPEPPPPPILVVREHPRGWRVARAVAALLADRAAEAVGSLAPMPCGAGGGDPSLPGPPARQRSLLVVTMARDLDGGVGAGGAAAGNTAAGGAAARRDGAAAAASARNAGWQAVRLAAGTPHGRLAVSVAVLSEARGADGVGARRRRRARRGRQRGGGGAAANAPAAAAAGAPAQAEQRARHLRAAAALLRLALAPLGIECRAAELRDVAAPAAAAAPAPGPVGGPQPPFVGPGAALARNAAVDAFFPSPSPGAKAGPPFPSFAPDAVVFADARAFFCAEDAFRLLSYPAAGGGAVDLVCALPLVDEAPSHRRQPSSSSSSLSAPPASLFDDDAGGGGGAARLHPDVPARLRLRSLRADGAADAARDVRGSALAPLPPFLVHANAAALARQGRPAPVRCCWGGLARLSAWPLGRGLRFRAGAADGACARPFHEASAFCGDLDRLSLGGARPFEEENDGAAAAFGPSSDANATAAPPPPDGPRAAAGSRGGPARVLLDPVARTSTQARVRRALAHPRFPYYYYTRMELGSWLDVRPLLRLAGGGAAGGGGGGGGMGAVFWPRPGVRTAAPGRMWRPSTRRVACCEAPPGGGGRPSLAGDCRPVGN